MQHRFIIQAARRRWMAAGVLALSGMSFVWAQAPAPASSGSGVAPHTSVLVLGDSMSAEYGLRRGTGWVALLAEQMKQAGRRESVINASISGDTTSGGRSRLPALLKQHQPKVLVIELGGNDALRGLPIAMTEANLLAMANLGRQAGAKVLLVGMQVPPNYGSAYAKDFAAVFEKVAKAAQAGLVPFLLSGVADGADPTAQFQADRIHPNERAQPRMMRNVWPALQKLL